MSDTEAPLSDDPQPDAPEPEHAQVDASDAENLEPGPPDAPPEPGLVLDGAGELRVPPPRRRVTEIGRPEVVDRRRHPILLLAGCASLVVLISGSLAAMSDAYRRQNRVAAVPQVEVPALVGVDGLFAERLIDQIGLVPEVVSWPNELVKVGSVSAQQPPGGTRLAQGNSVKIIVSTGPSRFVVPDVIGQQMEDARDLVNVTGLVGDLVPRYDESIRPGEVIESSPGPGIQVTGGSRVALFVSAGPAPRQVPDLTGRTVAEALNQIGLVGLAAGAISYERSELPPGTVLRTDPSGSGFVPRNTAVALVVAIDDTRVEVPPVEGLLGQSAQNVLSESGLSTKVVTETVPFGSASDGRVLRQGLAPNVEVPTGFTVEIVVGVAAPPPTTVPETIPETVPEPVPETVPETVPDTIPQGVPGT